MKSFLITKNDAGQRINKFLEKAVPTLPNSLMQKYFRIKRIKRNGKRCTPQEKLVEGDMLELYINDEFFEQTSKEFSFLRAPASIEFVYEDENIILADKQAGLVVHEDDENQTDTLINRILHYLYDKGEYNPSSENSFVPSLCNRIDRNTSGIVIAAKNAETLRILNQKIKDRQVSKRYLCLVHGVPQPPQAQLKDFLLKGNTSNQVRVSAKPMPGGKTILTNYNTLQTNGKYSLLEVDLKTGRTHQIRAHMAFYGYPLVGDNKYGHNQNNKDTGLRYQALCSYKLTFNFTTDSGILSYLNGQTFTVKNIPFADFLESGYCL